MSTTCDRFELTDPVTVADRIKILEGVESGAILDIARAALSVLATRARRCNLSEQYNLNGINLVYQDLHDRMAPETLAILDEIGKATEPRAGEEG
jgi:hypothetical protein